MLPPFTLAIPFHSNLELLALTVASVAAQTHKGCALLIVDDSPGGLSSGDRDSLAGEVRSRMPLRFVRTRGSEGMAAAWKRCLDEAETDLVTLVHGDDELTPEYAESVVALAERHPQAAAVFCGAAVIGADSKRTFSFPDWYKKRLIPPHEGELVLRGDQAVRSLLRGNYIFCPTLCYRRSKLGGRRFDPQYKFVLDLEFVSSLLLDGAEVVGMPDRDLYRYRRHENNMTAQLTRELTRFREEQVFYERMVERCTHAGFAEAARCAREARVIQLNLAFCAIRDAAGLRFRASGDKLRMLASIRRQGTGQP